MKNKKHLSKKQKKHQPGFGPEDFFFCMQRGFGEVMFKKTAELVKETEKRTGKLATAIFSMIHGTRPSEMRAWLVSEWDVSRWQIVEDSCFQDGFVPFAHITIIPYTDDFHDGKWINEAHFVLSEFEQQMSYAAIQARINQAMRLVEFGGENIDFGDRVELERQSKTGPS